MKKERNNKNFELKKLELNTQQLQKLIGGELGGSGLCVVDNVGGKSAADGTGLCVIDNIA